MTEIKRDRWGRPLIVPPGSWQPATEKEQKEFQRNDGRIPYTRVSTLAKALDSKDGLIQWKANITALGVAQSPDVYARLCALASEHEQPLKNPVGKRSVTELAKKAFIAGGGERAAESGTSVHTFCEMADRGQTIRHIPEELKGPIDAYREAMSGFTVREIEQFVVCDRLRAAGSLDKIVEANGEMFVADVKTGANEPKYPTGVTTQLAIYARGIPYANDLRIPRVAPLSITRGLLIHLPLQPIRGKYRCDLYWCDLTAGWERAVTASNVRKLPDITVEKVTA